MVDESVTDTKSQIRSFVIGLKSAGSQVYSRLSKLSTFLTPDSIISLGPDGAKAVSKIVIDVADSIGSRKALSSAGLVISKISEKYFSEVSSVVLSKLKDTYTSAVNSRVAAGRVLLLSSIVSTVQVDDNGSIDSKVLSAWKQVVSCLLSNLRYVFLSSPSSSRSYVIAKRSFIRTLKTHRTETHFTSYIKAYVSEIFASSNDNYSVFVVPFIFELVNLSMKEDIRDDIFDVLLESLTRSILSSSPILGYSRVPESGYRVADIEFAVPFLSSVPLKKLETVFAPQLSKYLKQRGEAVMSLITPILRGISSYSAPQAIVEPLRQSILSYCVSIKDDVRFNTSILVSSAFASIVSASATSSLATEAVSILTTKKASVPLWQARFGLSSVLVSLADGVLAPLSSNSSAWKLPSSVDSAGACLPPESEALAVAAGCISAASKESTVDIQAQLYKAALKWLSLALFHHTEHSFEDGRCIVTGFRAPASEPKELSDVLSGIVTVLKANSTDSRISSAIYSALRTSATTDSLLAAFVPSASTRATSPVLARDVSFGLLGYLSSKCTVGDKSAAASLVDLLLEAVSKHFCAALGPNATKGKGSPPPIAALYSLCVLVPIAVENEEFRTRFLATPIRADSTVSTPTASSTAASTAKKPLTKPATPVVSSPVVPTKTFSLGEAFTSVTLLPLLLAHPQISQGAGRIEADVWQFRDAALAAVECLFTALAHFGPNLSHLVSEKVFSLILQDLGIVHKEEGADHPRFTSQSAAAKLIVSLLTHPLLAVRRYASSGVSALYEHITKDNSSTLHTLPFLLAHSLLAIAYHSSIFCAPVRSLNSGVLTMESDFSDSKFRDSRSSRRHRVPFLPLLGASDDPFTSLTVSRLLSRGEVSFPVAPTTAEPTMGHVPAANTSNTYLSGASAPLSLQSRLCVSAPTAAAAGPLGQLQVALDDAFPVLPGPKIMQEALFAVYSLRGALQPVPAPVGAATANLDEFALIPAALLTIAHPLSLGVSRSSGSLETLSALIKLGIYSPPEGFLSSFEGLMARGNGFRQGIRIFSSVVRGLSSASKNANSEDNFLKRAAVGADAAALSLVPPECPQPLARESVQKILFSLLKGSESAFSTSKRYDLRLSALHAVAILSQDLEATNSLPARERSGRDFLSLYLIPDMLRSLGFVLNRFSLPYHRNLIYSDPNQFYDHDLSGTDFFSNPDVLRRVLRAKNRRLRIPTENTVSGPFSRIPIFRQVLLADSNELITTTGDNYKNAVPNGGAWLHHIADELDAVERLAEADAARRAARDAQLSSGRAGIINLVRKDEEEFFRNSGVPSSEKYISYRQRVHQELAALENAPKPAAAAAADKNRRAAPATAKEDDQLVLKKKHQLQEREILVEEVISPTLFTLSCINALAIQQPLLVYAQLPHILPMLLPLLGHSLLQIYASTVLESISRLILKFSSSLILPSTTPHTSTTSSGTLNCIQQSKEQQQMYTLAYLPPRFVPNLVHCLRVVQAAGMAHTGPAGASSGVLSASDEDALGIVGANLTSYAEPLKTLTRDLVFVTSGAQRVKQWLPGDSFYGSEGSVEQEEDGSQSAVSKRASKMSQQLPEGLLYLVFPVIRAILTASPPLAFVGPVVSVLFAHANAADSALSALNAPDFISLRGDIQSLFGRTPVAALPSAHLRLACFNNKLDVNLLEDSSVEANIVEATDLPVISADALSSLSLRASSYVQKTESGQQFSQRDPALERFRSAVYHSNSFFLQSVLRGAVVQVVASVLRTSPRSNPSPESVLIQLTNPTTSHSSSPSTSFGMNMNMSLSEVSGLSTVNGPMWLALIADATKLFDNEGRLVDSSQLESKNETDEDSGLQYTFLMNTRLDMNSLEKERKVAISSVLTRPVLQPVLRLLTPNLAAAAALLHQGGLLSPLEHVRSAAIHSLAGVLCVHWDDSSNIVAAGSSSVDSTEEITLESILNVHLRLLIHDTDEDNAKAARALLRGLNIPLPHPQTTLRILLPLLAHPAPALRLTAARALAVAISAMGSDLKVFAVGSALDLYTQCALPSVLSSEYARAARDGVLTLLPLLAQYGGLKSTSENASVSSYGDLTSSNMVAHLLLFLISCLLEPTQEMRSLALTSLSQFCDLLGAEHAPDLTVCLEAFLQSEDQQSLAVVLGPSVAAQHLYRGGMRVQWWCTSSSHIPIFSPLVGDKASESIDVQALLQREGVVVALGTCAKFLQKSDPRVNSALFTLLKTLDSPLASTQTAVARALAPLVATISKSGSNGSSENTEFATPIINRLRSLLVDPVSTGSKSSLTAQQRQERRGAAWGLAGILRGLGLPSIRAYNIIFLLEDSSKDKQEDAREGVSLLLEALCTLFDRLFEPYIIRLLPTLLRLVGDSSPTVRAAAHAAARAVMSILTGHGVRLVLPSVLRGLGDSSWRTKEAATQILGSMAYCAPSQLAASLPSVIGPLVSAFEDPHPQVQAGGRSALKLMTDTVKNPQIRQILDPLQKAIADPAEVPQALSRLVQLEFEHALDAPALAFLLPVLLRGLEDRVATAKLNAVFFTCSLCDLVRDLKDITPYVPLLLPALQATAVDPIPDIRSTSARALGNFVRSLTQDQLPGLLPWLIETVRSEESSVRRSGAAQALVEVLVAVGEPLLTSVVTSLLVLQHHKSAAAREGLLWLLVFLPPAMGDAVRPFVPRILPMAISGVADDNEGVREVALKCAQALVSSRTKSDPDVVVSAVVAGCSDPGWRVRQASVALAGQILTDLAGVVKMEHKAGNSMPGEFDLEAVAGTATVNNANSLAMEKSDSDVESSDEGGKGDAVEEEVKMEEKEEKEVAKTSAAKFIEKRKQQASSKSTSDAQKHKNAKDQHYTQSPMDASEKDLDKDKEKDGKRKKGERGVIDPEAGAVFKKKTSAPVQPSQEKLQQLMNQGTFQPASADDEEIGGPDTVGLSATAISLLDKAVKTQIAVLGQHNYELLLAYLYICRCDSLATVRQAAAVVWKQVVPNTPRALRTCMGELLKATVAMLSSPSDERRLVGGRVVAELVRKMGDRVLNSVIPVLRAGLDSKDTATRYGVSLGLAEVLSAATKNQLAAVAASLVPALRMAICDTEESVRKEASRAFAVLQKSLGQDAMDSVLDPLLHSIRQEADEGQDTEESLAEREEARERALNGLANVVSSRAAQVLPSLLEELLQVPISENYARALAVTVAAAGSAVFHHVDTLINGMLTSLELQLAPMLNDIDSQKSAPKLDKLESLGQLANVLPALHADCVEQALQLLCRAVEQGPSRKRFVACRLMQSLFQIQHPDRVSSAKPISVLVLPQTPLVLRDLVGRYIDPSALVRAAAVEALRALVAVFSADELVQLSEQARRNISGLDSDLRFKRGVASNQHTSGFSGPAASTADALSRTVLIDGLMSGGFEPLLTIHLAALVKGTGEQRESAARAISELVAAATNEAIRPLFVKITGPLIRLSTEKHAWQVKVAVLDALGLLIDRLNVAIKPFQPQLLTAFQKALQDPVNAVRKSAVSSLAKLTTLLTNVEPLVSNLIGSAVEAAQNDDGPVAESLLLAVSGVSFTAAPLLKNEENRLKNLENIIPFLEAAVEEERLAAAYAIGGLCRGAAPETVHSLLDLGLFVGSPSFQSALRNSGFSEESNSSFSSQTPIFLAGRAAAVIGILHFAPAALVQNLSELGAHVNALVSHPNPVVRELGCQTLGYVLSHAARPIYSAATAPPRPVGVEMPPVFAQAPAPEDFADSVVSAYQSVFDKSTNLIAKMLTDPIADVRKRAIHACRRLGRVENVQILAVFNEKVLPLFYNIINVDSPNEQIRYAANRALVYLLMVKNRPGMAPLKEVVALVKEDRVVEFFNGFAREVLKSVARDDDSDDF